MVRNIIITTLFFIALLNSFAQEINSYYYPEQNEEIKIDSILDKKIKLRVLIIRKTLQDSTVSISYVLENNKIQTHKYRDYTTEITLFKNDSIIFNRKFYKNDFEQIGDEEFLKKAITHSTWIQEFDQKSKTVKISYVIGVPETDWNYHFTLSIDKNGNYYSELDEIE